MCDCAGGEKHGKRRTKANSYLHTFEPSLAHAREFRGSNLGMATSSQGGCEHIVKTTTLVYDPPALTIGGLAVNHIRTPRMGVAAITLAAIATLSIVGCGKTASSSAAGGGSGGSAGGGPSTDPVAWTKNFCTAENAAFKGVKDEQDSFNAVNFSSDNATAQQQEITHLKKYQTTANTEITSLQSGGSPNVPAGSTFVSGLLKAWQTFEAVVETGITQANALDPTSSTFSDDLNNVGTTVNTAFSTLGTQYGAAVDAVNAQGSSDNEPFISTYNSDCNSA